MCVSSLIPLPVESWVPVRDTAFRGLFLVYFVQITCVCTQTPSQHSSFGVTSQELAFTLLAQGSFTVKILLLKANGKSNREFTHWHCFSWRIQNYFWEQVCVRWTQKMTVGKQVLPRQQTVRTEQFWQVKTERSTLLLPYHQSRFKGKKVALELFM